MIKYWKLSCMNQRKKCRQVMWIRWKNIEKNFCISGFSLWIKLLIISQNSKKSFQKGSIISWNSWKIGILARFKDKVSRVIMLSPPERINIRINLNLEEGSMIRKEKRAMGISLLIMLIRTYMELPKKEEKDKIWCSTQSEHYLWKVTLDGWLVRGMIG